jgi:hypothetical protein
MPIFSGTAPTFLSREFLYEFRSFDLRVSTLVVALFVLFGLELGQWRRMGKVQ